MLENILLVIFAGGLALSYRRLQFSNPSWVLLAGFVILHTIGAHYTYEKMPLGIWSKDFFHLSRNHYDRSRTARSDFSWPFRFVNCFCDLVASAAAFGVLLCRWQSFSRSAVALKLSRVSSLKSSRPEKVSTGPVGRGTNGMRRTISSRR